MEHYEEALKGMDKDEDADIRASIGAEIGYSLMELMDLQGVRSSENADRARCNIEDALTVFVGDEYAEERDQVSTALAALKKSELPG